MRKVVGFIGWSRSVLLKCILTCYGHAGQTDKRTNGPPITNNVTLARGDAMPCLLTFTAHFVSSILIRRFFLTFVSLPFNWICSTTQPLRPLLFLSIHSPPLLYKLVRAPLIIKKIFFYKFNRSSNLNYINFIFSPYFSNS